MKTQEQLHAEYRLELAENPEAYSHWEYESVLHYPFYRTIPETNKEIPENSFLKIRRKQQKEMI